MTVGWPGDMDPAETEWGGLPGQCYCTLDEYMDGHRHHCPEHRPCFDCEEEE